MRHSIVVVCGVVILAGSLNTIGMRHAHRGGGRSHSHQHHHSHARGHTHESHSHTHEHTDHPEVTTTPESHVHLYILGIEITIPDVASIRSVCVPSPTTPPAGTKKPPPSAATDARVVSITIPGIPATALEFLNRFQSPLPPAHVTADDLVSTAGRLPVSERLPCIPLDAPPIPPPRQLLSARF